MVGLLGTSDFILGHVANFKKFDRSALLMLWIARWSSMTLSKLIHHELYCETTHKIKELIQRMESYDFNPRASNKTNCTPDWRIM